MERHKIIIIGQVQGVGCRYFVTTLATKYQLTGFVFNRDDGNVELEVQGEAEKLAEFFKELLKGNQFVKIIDYHYKKIELVANDKKFKITY